MTFGSSSGKFATINGLDFTSNGYFTPVYNPGNLTLDVNQEQAVIVTVSAVPNPSAYGQSVTVTATVTAVSQGAGTPTGTIQFAVDGTNYGSALTMSGGSASLTTTPTYLTAGTHTITAVYSPDSTSNFTISKGSLIQTVSQVTPSFTNLSSPAITFGDNSDTVSGTISYAADSGTLFPTGSVVITVNGVSQSAPIDPTTGAFSSVFDTHDWPANPTGYAVSYLYAGDTNFDSSVRRR